MKDIILRPYRADDFFRVEGREGRPGEEWEWLAKLYQEHGRPALTALAEDRVIGCGGVLAMWTIGEIWLHISDEMVERPIWFHKSIVHEINKVKAASGLNRLQTAIPLQNVKNRKWIKALGFRAEGIARKYGVNGEDCMRYAWVRE